MTKSRSGAAAAKNSAATRRGIERGGASADAVARATSAPDSVGQVSNKREMGAKIGGQAPILAYAARFLRCASLTCICA